jgi:hypothetical protein
LDPLQPFVFAHGTVLVAPESSEKHMPAALLWEEPLRMLADKTARMSSKQHAVRSAHASASTVQNSALYAIEELTLAHTTWADRVRHAVRDEMRKIVAAAHTSNAAVDDAMRFLDEFAVAAREITQLVNQRAAAEVERAREALRRSEASRNAERAQRELERAAERADRAAEVARLRGDTEFARRSGEAHLRLACDALGAELHEVENASSIHTELLVTELRGQVLPT